MIYLPPKIKVRLRGNTYEGFVPNQQDPIFSIDKNCYFKKYKSLDKNLLQTLKNLKRSHASFEIFIIKYHDPSFYSLKQIYLSSHLGGKEVASLSLDLFPKIHQNVEDLFDSVWFISRYVSSFRNRQDLLRVTQKSKIRSSLSDLTISIALREFRTVVVLKKSDYGNYDWFFSLACDDKKILKITRKFIKNILDGYAKKILSATESFLKSL